MKKQVYRQVLNQLFKVGDQIYNKISIPINEYIQNSIKEHVRRLLWK